MSVNRHWGREEKTDNNEYTASKTAEQTIKKKKLMEFTQEQREKLGEFAKEVKCANNFLCFDLEPEEVFRKRTLGLEEYLECIGCSGDDPGKCQFSLTIFGNVYLCTCPVRSYIAKNMKG